MFIIVRCHLALVILWVGVLVPFLGAQTTSPLPVVTAYFSERPPFAIVDGQTGILINLTKAILSEAGIRARFIELPAPRIADLLKSGQTDALGVGWYRQPGAVSGGRYSLPIYQEQPMVVLMSARVASTVGAVPRLDGLLSSPLVFGRKTGVSLGPTMDQKIRAMGVVPFETVVGIPAMLRLIQGGRMDYTLLSEEEALFLLRQDSSLTPGVQLSRLVDAPPGNLRYFYYPEGFDPLLADRIDAAIEKLRNLARSPSSSRPLTEQVAPIVVDPPVFQNTDRVRNTAKTPTVPKTVKDGKTPLLPDPPSPVKP